MKQSKAELDKAFSEVEKVGLIVEVVPVTRYKRYIWILGEKFDAEDMEETLSEVRSSASSTYMTDSRMVKALTNIGVISGTSGSWGTSIPEKGGEERLNKFIEMLRAALRESKSDRV